MQQNCSVRWSRVKSLLLYDWAIDKNKITTTLGIIVGLYAALFIMAYWNQTRDGIFSFTGEGGETLVTFANVSVMNYFEYATLIVGILTTVILHRKFTNPQTSVQYLALPGSRLEKYLVMIADFVIVCLAMQVLYLVVYAISMLICQFTYPELSWWMNPYGNSELVERLMGSERITLSDGGELYPAREFMNTNTIQLLIWLSPFLSLTTFGLWTNVNMLFRNNGILKSIGIFILAYIVLIVMLIIFTAGFVTYVATLDIFEKTRYLNYVPRVIKAFLWLQIPLSLFLQWLFYRQIAKKQAK